MRLSEAQRKFRESILTEPKDLPADFEALFETGDIALPERLQVYRNNIIGGLADVMVKNFPVLEDLVGRGFLEGMARGFIVANPPREGNLNSYGSGFDRYIESYELAKAMPYLPDVARMEIAITGAYHAPDDAPLRPEDLAASDLPERVFRLRASATLIQSKWPLGAIRDFCLKKERGAEERLDIGTGGETLLIYRPGLKVVTAALEDDEFSFLRAVQDGQALGAAVERTLRTHPGFDLQAFLQRHLALETFTRLAPR